MRSTTHHTRPYRPSIESGVACVYQVYKTVFPLSPTTSGSIRDEGPYPAG